MLQFRIKKQRERYVVACGTAYDNDDDDDDNDGGDDDDDDVDGTE